LDGTLHLGIADHFVTERLPKLLSQFARTYPLVKLEVEVNSGIALMESLDACRLNLVIASREDAKQRPGHLLFREALVWVASKDFELSGTASIPLVLLPVPCQFRREALAALETWGRTWTTVYTGNSVPSIQAAVVAGLGVSVLGLHSVPTEMKILQPEEGFPELHGMDIMLYGEEKFQGSIAKALVGFILRAVHENELDRPLSQPTIV
jgi:DNA-binding transcriptional LysR family regulator